MHNAYRLADDTRPHTVFTNAVNYNLKASCCISSHVSPYPSYSTPEPFYTRAQFGIQRQGSRNPRLVHVHALSRTQEERARAHEGVI